MGAVYRARDLRLNRPVAVKVISVAAADAAAHERLRARFQREARAAGALHHPNVVAVYDYGTDEDLGLDFLVMELLRGEDLAARLARKGPPAVSTALHVLYQAARGLGAGHRAGLIHRDVKPGNLFLEPGDRLGEVQVRVLDFGIAEMAARDEETMTHLTVVGRSPFSPAYASPEQLLGETSLTPATDVFSLGAVGFQLLTGRRAFSTGDPRQQITQVMQAVNAELPRVKGLPTAVRIAIQRSLARTPHERFPHAGAFAEAIAIALPSDPGVEVIHDGAGFQDDDRTLLAPEPTPERVRVTTEPRRIALGTRFATPLPMSRLVSAPAAASLESLLPPLPPPRPSPEPPPPVRERQPSAPSVRPAPRRGWLRDAALAVWNFIVTATAFGLFAGAWFAAVAAQQQDQVDLDLLYLATAATVALTPFALHRLMGSRGSLRFALFASILASLATVYLVADGGNAEIELVLAALFMAQLLAVVFAEILTRRRAPYELDDDLAQLPSEIS